MLRRGLLATSTLIALNTSPSFSQESCDSILSNGIRNIEVTKGSSAALSMKYENYCNKDYENSSSTFLAEAEVSVFGVGSVEGKLDKKSVTTKLKDWCSTNKNKAASSSDSYAESNSISQAAVTAWQQCKALQANQEVSIRSKISTDLKHAIITLKYTGGSKDGVPFSPLNTSNWNCSVNNPGKGVFGNDMFITSVSTTITCARVGNNPALKQDDQTYDYWPSATIQLAAAGMPFGLDFEPIYNPSIPIENARKIRKEIVDLRSVMVPVSAVVPFFLTDKEISDLGPVWMPANGAKLNDASSPLNGQQLPNLENRFVLGSAGSEDVVAENIDNTSGSTSIALSVDLSGIMTEEENKTEKLGPTVDGRGGPFLTDTNVIETGREKHNHKLKGEAKVVGSFMPPFRKLRYLVRVR